MAFTDTYGGQVAADTVTFEAGTDPQSQNVIGWNQNSDELVFLDMWAVSLDETQETRQRLQQGALPASIEVTITQRQTRWSPPVERYEVLRAGGRVRVAVRGSFDVTMARQVTTDGTSNQADEGQVIQWAIYKAPPDTRELGSYTRWYRIPGNTGVALPHAPGGRTRMQVIVSSAGSIAFEVCAPDDASLILDRTVSSSTPFELTQPSLPCYLDNSGTSTEGIAVVTWTFE